MNKKLLTLAIGAAIAAPMTVAQADVKVYGAAQVEVARVKNDGTATVLNVVGGTEETNAIDNKRGRFGIAADEDLGGGMKGLAKFEYNMDTSDNNDNAVANIPFSARDSYVGMSGGFGTLRLGRSGSPYKQSGVALDPFVTTTLEARNNFGMSGNNDGYGVLFAHNSFVSNGIFYTTPSLGGVMINAYVGVDGTGAESGGLGQGAQSNGDLSVVASWKGGPANVFLGYNKLANTTDGSEPTAAKVGASFKLGNMHNIAVQYEMVDTGKTGGIYDTYGAEADYLFLSYTLTLGNFSLIPQAGAMTTNGGTLGDQQGNYLVLGGIYKMSKTFRMFGGYRGTTLEQGGVVSDTRDESVITVGMRKDF